MQRTIFIDNNTVVAVYVCEEGLPIKTPSITYDFFIPDPLCVFREGDQYASNLMVEKYFGGVVVPGTDATNSVYTPNFLFNRTAFNAAGLNINANQFIASPYVYAILDTKEILNNLQEYGARHNIKVPDYSLCNKGLLSNKLIEAGFSVLQTVEITSKTSFENLFCDRIILKPYVSCNSSAKNHNLAEILYRITNKLEAISSLEKLNCFDVAGNFLYSDIVAQQVADGNNENFDALILSGAVNGAGKVWHFSPLVLATQFNEAGRCVQSTWSPENDSDETKALQQKVETLIAGNKNCFYQLQFLRSNSAWAPHDFQYRMTYYVDSGLEKTGHQKYKEDIIKFVFDRSTDMPPMPASFSLDGAVLKNRPNKMQFASGATKAAAVAALGSA